MSQLSNALATSLADLVFNGGSYTSPTTIYLGLHETSPADDDSGLELTGNNYARQTITFGPPAARAILSTNAPVFTSSGGDWNTANYCGVYSTSSGAGLLAYSSLTAPFTILDTESRTFPIGNVSVEIRTAISTYLANALLNHTFRAVTYTSPTNVYLAHYTDDPTAADVGTELSGNAYAREIASWTAAANGQVQTDTEIDFDTATPAGQGVATYFGTHDALTTGNLLTFGQWSSSIDILVSKFFQLPVGNLSQRVS